MAYTPLVTVMATLVTITTFLEGFGRARLHRSIDQVGEYSQALITELANAAVPFARSEAYTKEVQRDFESPFKLPRSATVFRYGVGAAVPFSAGLFALLVIGIAGSGSAFEINPAHWDPLFTAALVLFMAQVALAVLTLTDSNGNEEELDRARSAFLVRLVNEAEKALHGDKPPDVETARLWADAVARTEANLPQDDRVRGILQSIEARFYLSAALWLEWESNSSTDTAGVTSQSTDAQLLREIAKARELLAALPEDARNVDSWLAYAVVIVADFSPNIADKPNAADTLWEAVQKYDVARPPRWLLVHEDLPWEQVINKHSGKDAAFLERWKLGDLANLLLYAGASDPKRREHCRLAAEALRVEGLSSDVEGALRAMFEACETPEDASFAYYDLTLDRGFGSAKVLVPFIQTAANQAGTWQKEAVHTASIEAGAGKLEAGKLRADPVGWMPVMDELRRTKLRGATTAVLTHAFPGKSATEATLAWLNLLDKSRPDKAEREALNLYFTWTRDGDRTAVNQQTVDTVVGLLARSSDEYHRIAAEWLQDEASTWTETKADDTEVRQGVDSPSGRIPPLT